MGRVFQPQVFARLAQMEEGWELEGSVPQVSRSNTLTYVFVSKPEPLIGCYIGFRIAVKPHAPQMKHGPSWLPFLPVNLKADTIRYIVLNRNGSANELEITSRGFSPLALFNEMKCVHSPGHQLSCPDGSLGSRTIYHTLRHASGFVDVLLIIERILT